ncbi:helix-turn-helix domain-containing protein [Streptomyces murinus]
MDGLFDLNDLPDGSRRPPGGLPDPSERCRLRKDSGLSAYQMADACSVSEATIHAWEEGKAQPRGRNAETYRLVLAALAARLTAAPGPRAETAEVPDWAALGALRHEIPTQASAMEPCWRCWQPTAQRVGGHPQHLGTRCAALTTTRTATAATPPPPAAAPAARPPAPLSPGLTGTLPSPRSPWPPPPSRARLVIPPWNHRSTAGGPLAVLEADAPSLTAHLADGSTRPCEAADLPELLAWALRHRLGAPPLRAEGMPAGPLLVLTSSALARLKLPATAPTGQERHPRSDHPLLRQIRSVGWQTDANGLGPWMRLHPSNGDPACDSIHLAVTDWGALHHDAWNLPPHFTAGQIALLLAEYTSLLRTPTGSPGTCGVQLMRDLRPAPHRHTTTGALVATGVRGALAQVVHPAPCEAPPGHQLAAHRQEKDVNADADIHWWRPPTQDEAARDHVVCLAVNLHHLAGSNSIRVSNGPAEHAIRPAFDHKTPGSWLVDLSTMPHHPQLPAPFAGTGPAWYTTPALAYAGVRNAAPQPTEGWLRRAPAVPYLDPFYASIRKARIAVLETLGITGDMDAHDLHQALDALPHADPGRRALLHAIHATAQDAFAVLAQPPTQPDQMTAGTWPTPNDPTWRPDLLAAVHANARANLHRKLGLTARDGYFPLAIAADHILYATHTPHLTEITDQPNCGFTIGIAAGHVRPVTIRPMAWFEERCAEGVNAAQILHDTCPAW